MIAKVIITFLLIATLFSCNGQNAGTLSLTTADPIHINRFDKELYQLIESGDTTLSLPLNQKYPRMLSVLGRAVLNMQTPEIPGFSNKLLSFYSEPTLKGLYKDAITRYESIEDIEQALGNGFANLKAFLPTMQIPAVYMHVSGLNQNVLVGDSLLSISIDKYMEKDYPLYQDFFYDTQKEKMGRHNIVSDYLAGWLISEYPFSGKENVLLERMIYEGKIKHLVSRALGNPNPAELMGYSEQTHNWCTKNEDKIWKSIIERKHLYTPDLLTTSKYFEDVPTIFPESDAPGNIGSWIGWQIVARYMDETGTTPEALMINNDAQAILTASKYKPL